MTKPRTPEEIAYDVWVAVHTPGNLSREVIFAALREAADARDAEWCAALWPTNPEGAEPIGPADGGEWYRRQVQSAADAARREERKALRRDYREWASGFLSGPSQVATEAWLDARSRAEEPKP